MTFALCFALFVFVLSVAYATLVAPWRNAIGTPHPFAPSAWPSSPGPWVSVVVPSRDAARTLGNVLQDLHAQSLPHDRFEVLVIDDHSSDGTLALVRSMARQWTGLRAVELAHGEGKKAAIALGVELARAPLVLVSDADVRSGPDRLGALVSFQQATAADMVLMPVRTEGPGPLGALQAEEQFALLGAAVGTASNGIPVLAYGANMAFVRERFLMLGGYAGQRATSGDDAFLLKRMFGAGMQVSFLWNAAATVVATAEPTVRGFFSQRLRWAGKMRAVGGAGVVLGLAVLVMPVALFAATILACTVGPGQGLFRTWSFVLAGWWLWVRPTVQLIGRTKRELGIAPAPTRSFLALLLFPCYAWPVALLSLVVRPMWKGRPVRV